MLGVGAVVVLHEHHAHLVVDRGVVVDELGELVNVFNDGLCADVSGRGFRAEDIRRGRKFGNSAILEAKVCIENAERVEQLALVLMHALDLHVENEVWRQHNAFARFNQLGELLLLHALDLVEDHNVVV